ncbi:MAG: radical SAM protein, partial [Treponema sp.]|nr:radical SAM protein [Treponema sp.]
MNVTIIQPPLVQLNTPYPSGAYLKSFFQKIKSGEISGDSSVKIENVQWLDFSTLLFHKIFSQEGLKKLFSLSEKQALKLAATSDEETAFQLRRYLSTKDLWINWIDRIVEILCGGNSAREFSHEFVRSPYVPRGNRMENFLYNLTEQGREVSTDEAKILASLALADMADYITAVFDHDFRLISYAEHLGTSTASFDDVLNGLKAPVLNYFYKEIIRETFFKTSERNSDINLFLISVPFPGCFEAAVFTARELRNIFGNNAIISLGGGYVNTELRNIRETRIFDFFDLISYDMGYGSYLNLLNEIRDGKCVTNASVSYALDGKCIYKTKYFLNKKIICDSESNCEQYHRYSSLEKEICKKLIPDFSDIDFSKYPRLADDTNPMHSIWNDGSWLKAYMAHGCYWHRCAFCDTQLEYVNRFCKVETEKLCDGLTEQAKKTGVWGIHFVDEACPPASMVQFGLKNLINKKSNGRALTWWGNIRFEKTFTRDMADFLSYSGLT